MYSTLLLSIVTLVRLKEEGRGLERQHRVYYGDVALQRRSPARELEPTAAYKLGVDKGGGEVPGRSRGKIILNVPLTLQASHFF
jgi:hypothetical protein